MKYNPQFTHNLFTIHVKHTVLSFLVFCCSLDLFMGIFRDTNFFLRIFIGSINVSWQWKWCNNYYSQTSIRFYYFLTFNSSTQFCVLLFVVIVFFSPFYFFFSFSVSLIAPGCCEKNEFRCLINGFVCCNSKLQFPIYFFTVCRLNFVFGRIQFQMIMLTLHLQQKFIEKMEWFDGWPKCDVVSIQTSIPYWILRAKYTGLNYSKHYMHRAESTKHREMYSGTWMMATFWILNPTPVQMSFHRWRNGFYLFWNFA